MVSRWIFRELLEAVRSFTEPGSELDRWILVGIANDMLDMDLIDPVVGRELVDALRTTAERQLSDETSHGHLSAADAVVYQRALRTLVSTMDT